MNEEQGCCEESSIVDCTVYTPCLHKCESNQGVKCQKIFVPPQATESQVSITSPPFPHKQLSSWVG